MHGQSRDVAPCRLFPMHTMHMPSDRWMCQFHRGSVSIRTRVIFIDSKITIRSLSSDARCESERVIFLGAINLPPILIQDTESATVNGRTIERRYPTRTFFCQPHRRTRERVLSSSVTRTRVIKEEDSTSLHILLMCSIPIRLDFSKHFEIY